MATERPASLLTRAGALSAAATLALGLPAAGAVLPLSDDGLPGSGFGPRAELVAPTLKSVLTGQWRGETPCGSTVTLELHAVGRELTGEAHFGGMGAVATGAVRVTPLMVGPRTMLFSISGRAGGRASYGVLTFVSDASVRLDLQTGASPLSLTLARIG